MKLSVVPGIPHLFNTPKHSITVSINVGVRLEVDDVNLLRMEIVFWPYQALKITTADCFLKPNELFFEDGKHCGNRVLEIHDSDWIPLLKQNLSLIDHGATFMEKAKHFVVPLQDDFLEVICWNVQFRYI